MSDTDRLAESAYAEFRRHRMLATHAKHESVVSTHMENAMRSYHLWRAYCHILATTPKEGSK